jgi:hypothetical protein
MNRAAKGRRNEHRSMGIFEQQGYTVMRSAGSHGDWDFIAWDGISVALVQVRTRDWPGLLERQALAEQRCPPNFKKLLHRWRKHKRSPDLQEL